MAVEIYMSTVRELPFKSYEYVKFFYKSESVDESKNYQSLPEVMTNLLRAAHYAGGKNATFEYNLELTSLITVEKSQQICSKMWGMCWLDIKFLV